MSKKKQSITCSIGEKEFLTIDETMAYLCVSDAILRRWRNEGLKYIELEGRIYYAKEHLKEFLLSKTM